MAELCEMNLPDQADRARFIEETERNFSVIAPAGVGKTRAIVDRVVNIANNTDPVDGGALSRMVVVTYTRNAAEEMHGRARSALMAGESGSAEKVNLLQRAYFGTIHSFCLLLLQQFGHVLGVSRKVDIAESDEMLWHEYLRQTDIVAPGLPGGTRRKLFRSLRFEKVAELARLLDPFLTETGGGPIPDPPELEFSAVRAFSSGRKNVQNSIREANTLVDRWEAGLQDNEGYLPLPDFGKGGSEFQALWKAAFAPMRDWIGRTAFAAAAEIARDYRAYRVERGLLRYDDLTGMAGRLLADGPTGRRIRARGYRVLLDEAQDTDPGQFRVLTEVARSEGAVGIWLETGEDPPEPGRFCMVGDPQQSIYGSRSDLRVYQDLHGNLVGAGAAEALVFSVTFRCAEEVVSTVNRVFPAILDGTGQPGEQVRFFPLTARPGAAEGQVARAHLAAEEGYLPGRGEAPGVAAFADAFSGWFAGLDLACLRARDWSEVAILCPRNRWLETIGQCLQSAGVETQLLSRKDALADNPAFAWLTALTVIMGEPENAFEIAGVLREIYGVSDHDMAVFCRDSDPSRRFGHPLQIVAESDIRCPVGGALRELAEIRRAIETLPLRDAIRLIVSATELRDRLEELPGYSGSELVAMLDRWVLDVSAAEENRLTIGDWGQFLRECSEGTAGDAETRSGRVQLVSCHKAKGLEWDAVILPFFNRPIRFASRQYPRVIRDRTGGGASVTVDRAHDRDDHRALAVTAQNEELDRLLYVAMTRARESLILTDDAEFFRSNNGSFADRLGVSTGAANQELWQGLADTLIPDHGINRNDGRESARESIGAIELFDSGLIERGSRRSRSGIRRVIPSSLAVEDREAVFERDEPEGRLGHDFPDESVAGGTGAEYGNWWHEMMETAPWESGIESWREYARNALSKCPDVDRGRRELDLFTVSACAAMLFEDGASIHTEAPVLWRADESLAYEGLIDLVGSNRSNGKWFVVDWKTDRLSGDTCQLLRDRYGPQIRVYGEAVSSICETETEAWIYSTVSGELISVT